MVRVRDILQVCISGGYTLILMPTSYNMIFCLNTVVAVDLNLNNSCTLLIKDGCVIGQRIPTIT